VAPRDPARQNAILWWVCAVLVSPLVMFTAQVIASKVTSLISHAFIVNNVDAYEFFVLATTSAAIGLGLTRAGRVTRNAGAPQRLWIAPVLWLVGFAALAFGLALAFSRTMNAPDLPFLAIYALIAPIAVTTGFVAGFLGWSWRARRSV